MVLLGSGTNHSWGCRTSRVEKPVVCGPMSGRCVEVGTSVARRPPHRSRRAVFPHRALQVNSLSHAPTGASPAT